MGFKIDFTVEGGSLIDDHCPTPLYTQDVVVRGSSVTDSIVITQGDQQIWFDQSQFEEFINKSLKSSIFSDFRRSNNVTTL